MLRRLLLLSLALLSLPAHALLITGDFTGYAWRSIFQGTDSPADGHGISGSFLIDTDAFANGPVFNFDPNLRYFSITVTHSPDGSPTETNIGAQSFAWYPLAGDTEQLYAKSYYPKGFGVELWLTGDLFDPGFALPFKGNIDLDESFLYSGFEREVNFVGTYYKFTSVDYRVSQVVPEPASLALLGVALAIAGGLRRRR